MRLRVALAGGLAVLCRGEPTVAAPRNLEGVVGQAWAEPWPPGQVPSGHGFAVAPDLVLTNAHTVAGCRVPLVEAAGREQRARLVGLDARIDAALLRVGAAGRPFRLAGDPGSGEPVVVLTRRAGTPGAESISGRGTRARHNSQASNVAEIEAILRPGDSGAPVLTLTGEVVGMVVGRLSGEEGRAVVMPSSGLRPFLAYHGARRDVPGREVGEVARVRCER